MERVVVTKNGPPSVLQVVTTFSKPVPGPDEVLIKTAFAGVNFADCLQRMGIYRPKPQPPFTPGYELSGTVLAVGSNVQNHKEGDLVIGVTPNGAQASYVCVKSNRCFPIPKGISLKKAAAIPVTYLTAWHMLVFLGNIKNSDSILIHGVSGGVGTAATQIAKTHGVKKLYGTASKRKQKFVEENGVTFIDRKNEDFVSFIQKTTQNLGIDHILDPIGGSNLKKSLSVLSHGGKLYTFGLSEAAPHANSGLLKAFRALRRMPKINPTIMMSRNQGIFGVHIGTFARENILNMHMQEIIQRVISGDLDPIIDSTFSFDQISEAHYRLHSGLNIGKILLCPND